MYLRDQFLPSWYDLVKPLLQEQLIKMFRRFIWIQRSMYPSFNKVPIRFGLERNKRLHPNIKHLPRWILFQWCKMYPISILWKWKSLEWYSQPMCLSSRWILERCWMHQMRYWPALCQWRLLLSGWNILRWRSMRSKNRRQVHRYSKLQLERYPLCLFPRILNHRQFVLLWWYRHGRLLWKMRRKTQLCLHQWNLPMQQRLCKPKWCVYLDNRSQCWMQCRNFLWHPIAKVPSMLWWMLEL